MLSSSRLEALLYRHDPIGLGDIGAPKDEYSPEARTIAGRLHETQSAADVQRIMHEEFVHWFDDSIAGPVERYEAPAREAWALMAPAIG